MLLLLKFCLNACVLQVAGAKARLLVDRGSAIMVRKADEKVAKLQKLLSDAEASVEGVTCDICNQEPRHHSRLCNNAKCNSRPCFK